MADSMLSRLRLALRAYRGAPDLPDSCSMLSGSLSAKSSWLGSDTANNKSKTNLHTKPAAIDFANSSPKFLPLDCTGEVPTPRSGHVTVVDGQGVYMYVFGGYHESKCYNDLYRYHIPSRNWTKLHCTGDIPTPRVSHQAIMDGDHLIVFGGSNVPFGQSNSNDLYVCNVRTCHWSLLETTAETANDIPAPRYGHTMVRRGHHLYVFAGTAGCVYYNDLYKLNMHTLCWSRIPQVKPAEHHSLMNQHHNISMHGRPSPRYRHEAVADEEYMYVIGGGTPNPGDTPIDVYTYHFSSNTWQRRLCAPAVKMGPVPIARRSHTCVLFDNKIYLFGGTDGHTMYLDFWCLDLANYTWRPISLHAKAAGAKCFHAAAVTPQGCMYMFGGCADSNGSSRSKEVSACYLAMPSLKDLCAHALGVSHLFSPNEVAEMDLDDDRLAELICDYRK